MKAKGTMFASGRVLQTKRQSSAPSGRRRAVFILPNILSGGELPAGQEGGRQPPLRRLPQGGGQA